MPFKLSELTEEELAVNGVFKDVIDAQWESYENPDTRIMNLFFPIKGK